MRKIIASAVLVGGLVVPAVALTASTAQAAQTCSTSKVAVTHLVKVTEKIREHGKLVTKTVEKREDVKVTERVKEKVRVKVDGKVKTETKTVTKLVVKYRSVTTCTALTATVSTVSTAPSSSSSTSTPASTTAAPAVVLSAVDPTYSQSTTNPLAVVWAFSASASETVGGVSQLDPSLPAGVLELFSNGALVDSVNVGSSTTGSTWGTTYAAYGDETVDVIYDSGTNSATTGPETVDLTQPTTTTTESLVQGACTETSGITVDFPNAWAYVDYQCAYDVTITTIDSNGNVIKSGLSAGDGGCDPASGQTTCTLSDAQDTVGASVNSVAYGEGEILPPSPAPLTCSSANPGSVVASFAGDSADAASESAPQTVYPISGCS